MKRCFAIFFIGLMNLPLFSLSGCHTFGTRQEATGDDLRTSPGMVLIPAGVFELKSHEDDEFKTRHFVYMNAFYMDKREVTNAQYKRFIDANPTWRKDRIAPKYHDGGYLKMWRDNTYPRGRGDRAVENVSWYAAMAYAAWVGKRLPTEVEWEKAADEGGMYYLGIDLWEWCLDEYESDFYVHSPNRNPLAGGKRLKWVLDNATEVTSDRVLRGGGWLSNREYIGGARESAAPTRTFFDIGFRCVWSPTDAYRQK